MTEQQPGPGGPPPAAEAEQHPDPTQKLWLRVKDILDSGDAWINSIPEWIPIVRPFCRYYVNTARASATTLFRRDEAGESIPLNEALVESGGLAIRAIGNFAQAGLEAVGAALIIRSGVDVLSRQREQAPRQPTDKGPGPAPEGEGTFAPLGVNGRQVDESIPKAEQSEPSSAISFADRVKRVLAYFDELFGDRDEQFFLAVIAAGEFFAGWLLPEGKAKTNAQALLKWAKRGVEAKQHFETAAAIVKGAKQGKDKAAENAVKKAGEVVRKAGPDNPPPTDPGGFVPSIARRPSPK